MLILCTAVLAWVINRNGVVWEGAGAGYLLALFADFLLLVFLIYRLTE